MLSQLKKELQTHASPEKAVILQCFFKTGKGQYGEGDIFLGIKVQEQRKAAKKYTHLPLIQVQKLLSSKIHEHRLTALIILTYKIPKASEQEKQQIFNLYLNNTKYINNWDLVDLSAPNIIGTFLLDKPRDLIYKLANSKDLWEKRIAILSTFAFIKQNRFGDALKISEIMLKDKHDLIHKAVGWMLREIGKRDQKIEETFLRKHYKIMPRTMLRYAIEGFEEKKRKFYMGK